MPASAAIVGEAAETELIERIRRKLPPPPPWLLVGIGDDAAVVAPDRNRLEVLTVDALVEGVHFDRRFTPPEAIGHRALAVNLSDLAAMGAEPRLALVSLALPAALLLDDFDALVGGLTRLAAAHRLHVAGGNVTRSPGPLVLDITVAGSVKPRRAMTRAGARPGDLIYVSGTLGAGTAGLEALRAGRGGEAPAAADWYLFPQPRVRLGTLIARNRAAAAGLDLSDGLADGVRRLAGSGGVGIRIDAAAVPVAPDARRWFESRGEDPVDRAVRGGDDYELLVAVRPRQRGRLAAARRHGGVAITEIGVCTAAPELVLRTSAGGRSRDIPLPEPEFAHFA
jgi:thiamine-monophosphate kinase